MFLNLFVCSLVTGHDLAGDSGLRRRLDQTNRRRATTTQGYYVSSEVAVGHALRGGFQDSKIIGDADSETSDIGKIKNGRAACNEAARAWATGSLLMDGVFPYFEPQSVGPQQCGQVWDADGSQFVESPDRLETGLTGDCSCRLEIFNTGFVGGFIPNESFGTLAQARTRCEELGPWDGDDLHTTSDFCQGVYCEAGENTSGYKTQTCKLVNPALSADDFDFDLKGTSYKLACRSRTTAIPVHWECRYQGGSNSNAETFGHTSTAVTDPLCECVYDEDAAWGKTIWGTNQLLGRHAIHWTDVTTSD